MIYKNSSFQYQYCAGNSKFADKISYSLLLLFFISLGFSRFYIELGSFALKPYMLAIVTILFYLTCNYKKRLVFVKTKFYEQIYILFLLLIAFSFIFSLYPYMTLRWSAGVIVLVLTYLTIRTFYNNFLNFELFKKAIMKSSYVISLSSLAYYGYGFIALNFNLSGNDINSFGVLIDKGLPRLAGVISNDPNISSLLLSILIFFTFTNKSSVFLKIILLSTFVLTFSRGAYLALLVASALHLILNHREILKINAIKKTFTLIITAWIALAFFSNFLNFSVLNSATTRVENIPTDNGSNRIALWRLSLQTIYDYPIFGIGPNSTLNFNMKNYGIKNYTHNTFLDVLSELGIIGLFVYLFFIATTLRIAIKLYREKYHAPFLIVVSFLVQSIFLSIVLSEIYVVILFILFAYILKSENQSNVIELDNNST